MGTNVEKSEIKSTMNPDYKYIFGPVPSRRLGLSLGVDLVPHKTCTLDCVYCECGKTTHLTVKRKEFTPTKQIISELALFLKDSPPLDSITFSGSGEPTLHEGIGEIIDYIKNHHPQYNVALLTNSTLFHQAQTRNDVMGTDIIIASFDAAQINSFNEINRPHPDIALENIIEGLSILKKEFKGQLWLEIFIVPGINDIKPELDRLKSIIDTIGHDGIQINSLDRPGTESWVEPLEKAKIKEIAGFFNKAESVLYREPNTSAAETSGSLIMRILSTVRRRPCTVGDLSDMLGIEPLKVKDEIGRLIKDRKLEEKVMQRGVFYKAL